MKKMFTILLLVIISASILGTIYGTPANSSRVDVTLMNQDPDPAEPGEYLELRFKIEKLGAGTVESAEFNLELEYPFSFDPSDKTERTVTNIKVHDDDEWYYALKYKILVDKDALEGDYEVTLKSKFNNASYWKTNEFSIDIEDKDRPSLVLGTLQTSPTRLVSDTDEAELSIEIQNIGDASAQNVIAELELPEGFEPTYGYSDRYNLGSIASDSSATATFYLNTDKYLKSDNYPAIVNITYKEEGDEDNEYKTKGIDLDIPIKNKPMFEITNITTIPEKLVAGTKDAKIKLNIKNIGEEGESISLRAFKESSQPFDYIENTDYIGKLAFNGSGEAILTMDIDSELNTKIHSIDLELRTIYQDEVIVQNESINIELVSKEDSAIGHFFTNHWASITLIIVILLVSIATIVIVRRKRK